ncbi:hypothetical protein FGIG_09109 [Fasciola gigantica]|uniref:Uncharacterized protein n=1 Tax=Fasciola gigantica TaxID=46835 RepID=A0A504ZAL5_FASGI|nr:hypothetical protein FGIG_09109 [Fasciola gigantica]
MCFVVEVASLLILYAVLNPQHLASAFPLEEFVDVENEKFTNPFLAGMYYRKIRSPKFPRVGKRFTRLDQSLIPWVTHAPLLRVALE